MSNLGSSLGVAIAGTVIVAELATANAGFALALVVLIAFGVIGLIAALLMPAQLAQAPEVETSPAT